MPAEIWQPVSVLPWTCRESNPSPDVVVDLSVYVCSRFTAGIEGAVKRLHHSTFWVRREDRPGI